MDFQSFGKRKVTELRLQFYTEYPSYNVPLQLIEELAVERLKVLRCLEATGQDYVRGGKEYNEKLLIQLRQCSNFGKSLTFDSSAESSKSMKTDIKNDNLSQFILAMAYCRTEDLSRWFMQQELDLFRFRFMIECNHDSKSIERFIESNKIMLIPATEAETAIIRDEVSIDLAADGMICKVRFDEVCDLLKKKRCYIIGGFVYLINASDISSVIVTRLRVHLSRTLTTMRANLGVIDEDERLRPLLATLNKRYTGPQYGGQDTRVITAVEVPSLVKSHFPLCMAQVHGALTRDHHLKHAARMQYGLFLKAAGLPLQEALKFWSESFRPLTDVDQFAKKYAYNIRHNYGQEGKRVSYTAYSCVKIITAVAGGSDCCGCPFQTTSPDDMATRLRATTAASETQVESIVGKMRSRHYQISCRDYFKMAHQLADDFPLAINHPNQYFEESRKLASSVPK